MITIELNEHSAEDVKLIQELQKAGVPDDLIQKAYDAGQRNQAEWIRIGDYDCDNNAPFECSNCHAGDTHAKGVRVPYCWKCGAKMKGAKDE